MATGNFYTFSKRKNSTLQPTGTGTQIDLQLKSGTSLISPTFLISQSGKPSYNYVSFEGRYYFINDVVSVRQDLWEISCSVDALASWKSDVGGTTALIMYATGGSSSIIDQRIPPKANAVINSDNVLLTGDFSGFTDYSEGIPLVSLTGVNNCGTYLIDSDKVRQLMLNIDLWTPSITDVETAITQRIRCGDAPANLRSVIYLPIILSTTSNFASPVNLYLGTYPCTDYNGNAIEGRRVTNPFLAAAATVNIPWHFSDWRRNAPYTKVFLYLPCFGTISLPASDLINETGLIIRYSLNMNGGDIAFQVRGNVSRQIVATGSCNIAMQTPYGSSNINVGKVAGAIGVGLGAIASVAAGVVTGGAATVALGSGLAASAGGLISALGGESGGGGGLSGSAVTGLDNEIKCWTVSRDISDSQSSLDPVIGKPVFAKHTIGSYSGYVQTDGCCIAGNMLDQERETINRLCDGGIYYE